MCAQGPIVAAGSVVFRRKGKNNEVLLVHRPKYDDWAFPKGKLDPHEPARTAAIREVLEETGVAIRLGPPLLSQTYAMGNGSGRTKLVHYWVGRAVGDDDVSKYAPNTEIDGVEWLPVAAAARRMSYEHDRATLVEALPFARMSYPVIVLRHAQARSRRAWKGNDEERTLTKFGERQAERISPALAAYGVDRLVSSSSRRCWTTLAPFGMASELDIEVLDVLTEGGATTSGVSREARFLLSRRHPIAVCTHRPVLPDLFRALGIDPQPLDPAGIVVVHHRKGRIVAIERIAAPSGR